ncbi:MAG: S26 family signal peptidase [Planctomycetes bacterium]|nr:S26 family signal peptidase [Planctomycetota bacterium]
MQEPIIPEDLLPPRAGWKKFFRPLLTPIRRFCAYIRWEKPEKALRIFMGGKIYPGESITAMVFSIIPGLGHRIAGRPGAALIAFGIWAVILVGLVNFYSGQIGGILAGLLISWHAVVIFDAGKVQQHVKNAGARIYMIVVLLLLVTCGYLFVNAVVTNYVMIINSPTEIEKIDLLTGDIVVIDLDSYEEAEPQRGDVVAFRPMEYFVNENGRLYANHRAEEYMLARVVAIAGDRVKITPEGVKVNGKAVPPESYAAGVMAFPEKPLGFTVDSGYVFIPFPLRVREGAPSMRDTIWTQAYDIPVKEIAGSTSGVYLPIWRRHSFEEED